MRITCPGCGSLFDVPDRAVPHPGRDVQCATCGTSWFLLRAGGAEAGSGPVAGPDAAAHPRGAASVEPAGVGQAAHPGGASGLGGGSAGQAAHPGGASGLGGGARVCEPDLPPARRVAPEVLAILRAEAETERRARQRAAVRQAGPPQDDPDRLAASGGGTNGAAAAGDATDRTAWAGDGTEAGLGSGARVGASGADRPTGSQPGVHMAIDDGPLDGVTLGRPVVVVPSGRAAASRPAG